MKRFTEAVRQAISQRNWYAALALALSLPDMCASIEHGRKATWREYSLWFSMWVEDKYTVRRTFINEDHANDPINYINRMREEGRLMELVGCIPNFEREEKFLTGTDCYCLRCSYIHEASNDISSQRIRETIDRFHFIYPAGTITLHNNRVQGPKGTVLQLQVDLFCLDICAGVLTWLKEMERSGKQLDSMPLMEIHPPSTSF